jgi:hypothetical protein
LTMRKKPERTLFQQERCEQKTEIEDIFFC